MHKCEYYSLFVILSVSSINKVSCRWVRDVSSNPTYTKNQLMTWLDGKINYHGADAIDSNAVFTIKKKKKILILFIFP